MVYKPFNNELGQKIYDGVSQQAWMLWVEHSKRIVNEYRLDLTSPQGQKILLEQAQEFFFGAGGAAPPDFVPEGAAKVAAATGDTLATSGAEKTPAGG
jgi:Fe-S cluster biosynthesis and repair protein YggX